jgi:hypothetical protein
MDRGFRLRAIYYPEGFAFPLKVLNHQIAVTELLREAATMIMLVIVAFLVQKEALSRFAIFIYTFAVWDIFYYLFLYFLLSWTTSLFTWDILFLIPVMWVGPVLAPLINSLTMIILALLILSSVTNNQGFRLRWFEWILIIAGSVITIIAYTQPYFHYLLDKFTLRDIFLPGSYKEIMEYSMNFIPLNFNWYLFGFAELLFLYSIGRIFLRTSLSRSGDHQAI